VGVEPTQPPPLTPPELLNERHDLTAFACGEVALDDWLRRRALANQASGASRTYVLCEGAWVIGYYRLASGAIAMADAPSRVRRNMPDPIPMIVLGRLAIDRAAQGKGIGKLLLRDAILRTHQAAAIVGIRGMLVHALSPAAKRFYESCGFQVSPSEPMTLLLALKDAAAILGEGPPG
jgi:GNAT superfamily N-acetyltransferase